jgi:serine phosphatase RsbU (regulator of sigma subunit)
MQWDLLPLPTYRDPQVEVAGRVEPAYDIGGDAFDFAANHDTMEIGVFDAMGHGLGATLLTTLAVGAYRYGRRRLSELPGVAGDIDEAVGHHVGGEAFVTGHVCRLDPATGEMAWVNCGHPLPLLVRDHAAAPLEGSRPCLPFGLGVEATDPIRIQLQPDDIVLFYSDGLIEARPNGGTEFGMERLGDIAGRHGDRDTGLLPLVRSILDEALNHAGHLLRDDATLVAVRWSGPGR